MFKRSGMWWTCIRFRGRKIQKSLDTPNKGLARSIEAKIRTELAEGTYFDIPGGKNKTYRNLAERYMAECTVKKAVRSQERDRGIFKNNLVPAFGNVLICDIAPKNITRYKLKRKEQGATPDTINKELGLMKASFNVAIREWEWLNSNPVSKVRMETPGKGRVRFLSAEEFKQIYVACPGWLQPIVLVARYTGLRQSNVLSLGWSQIDLFRKVITVEETKNGDSLGLPICDPLRTVLINLKKVQGIHTDLVFYESDGLQISRGKVHKAFMRVCKKAGIDNFRWHDLRHDFASHLVQNGVDLFRVQKLLGHKDGRITQRYAHLAPENLQSAVDTFQKVDYNLTAIEDSKKSKSL